MGTSALRGRPLPLWGLLLALLVSATADGFSGASQLLLTNSSVGALSAASVRFEPAVEVPADATLEISLPYQFCHQTGVSAALGQEGMDGGLSASALESTVWLSRDGSGAAVAAGTAVSLSFGYLDNPWTLGDSGNGSLTLRAASGAVLASGALLGPEITEEVVSVLDAAQEGRSSVVLSTSSSPGNNLTADAAAHSLELTAAAWVVVEAGSRLTLGGPVVSCALRSRPRLWGLGGRHWAMPGEVIGPVAFSVNDSDTALGALALSVESSNHTVVHPLNVTFDASLTGVERSLSIAAWAHGAATLTVQVFDGFKVARRDVEVSVNNTEPESGVFALLPARVLASEGAGAVTLVVSRLYGSQLPASVRVVTVADGGTATAGADYEPVNATLQWAAGDASDRTVTLVLLDDVQFEGNETVALQLVDAQRATLLAGNSSSLVTILGPNDEPSDESAPYPVAIEVSETAFEFVVSFDRPVYCSDGALCNATVACAGWLSTSPASTVAACEWLPGGSQLRVAYEDGADVDVVELSAEGQLRAAPGSTLYTFGSFAVTTPRTAAPTLSSGVLAASGASLTVEFAGDACARLFSDASAGPVPCDEVFAEADAALLGASASCAWQRSHALKATLGSGATVVPGHALCLLDGVVKPVQDSVVWAAGCVSVSAPAAPPVPAVSLTAPRTVDVCSPVVADASASTGGAGRALEFAWTVNNASLGNDSSVEFEGEVGAEYLLQVTARNFFGQEAQASALVRKSAYAVPAVTLLGPAVDTLRRGEAWSLEASASASACSQGDDGLVYEWETVSGDVDVSEFVGNNPRRLRVPAYTLSYAPSEYVVRVTVSQAGNALLNNSAEVQLTVVAGPIEAAIIGGDRSGLSTSSEVVLSAIEDPDFGDGTVDADRMDWIDFSYEWSSSPFVADLEVVEHSGGGELLIPSGALAVGDYEITVNASKRARWGTASVTVSVAIDDLTAPPSVTLRLTPAVVNPGDQARLVGSLSSSAATWEWTADDADFADSGSSLEPYASSPADRSYLTLPAGLLSAGVQYTFRLTAADEFGRSASATVSVVPNSAPSLGSFSVSPSGGGVALVTAFQLRAVDWTDDEDGLPLRYSFAADGKPLSSDASLSNSLTTVLGKGAAVALHAVVWDALGASAQSETRTVAVAAATTAQSTGLLRNLTVAAVQSGNAAGLMQATLSAATLAAEPCRQSCEHGRCVNSVCLCDSGYEGDNCDAVLEVAGELSAWSDWSACSVSCGGGGSRTRSRSCEAEASAGAVPVCDEDAEYSQEDSCGTDACTAVVNGGWTAWSAWSTCSATCESLTGATSRTRSCSAPAPSADGAACAGEALQQKACFATQCLATCPGSSADSSVECSGNGQCLREPASCSAVGDTCSVLRCKCADGFAGSGCQYATEAMAELQELREEMLLAALDAVELSDPSEQSLQANAEMLEALLDEPDQVSSSAASMALDAATILVESSSSETTTQGTTESLLGVLSGLVLAAEQRDEMDVAQQTTGLVQGLAEAMSVAMGQGSSTGVAPVEATSELLTLVAVAEEGDRLSSLRVSDDVTVDFPSGGAGTGSDVVIVSSMVWKRNPVASNGSSAAEFARPVFSLSLLDAQGTELRVERLSAPISFSLQAESLAAALAQSCSSWNTTEGDWSGAGMTAASVRVSDVDGSVFVSCLTTHLTDFSMGTAADGWSADSGALAVFAESLLLLDETASNASALAVVASLLGVVLALSALALAADGVGGGEAQRALREHYLAYGTADAGFLRSLLQEGAVSSRLAELSLLAPLFAPALLRARLPRFQMVLLLGCYVMAGLAAAAAHLAGRDPTMQRTMGAALVAGLGVFGMSLVLPGLVCRANAPAPCRQPSSTAKQIRLLKMGHAAVLAAPRRASTILGGLLRHQGGALYRTANAPGHAAVDSLQFLPAEQSVDVRRLEQSPVRAFQFPSAMPDVVISGPVARTPGPPQLAAPPQQTQHPQILGAQQLKMRPPPRVALQGANRVAVEGPPLDDEAGVEEVVLPPETRPAAKPPLVARELVAMYCPTPTKKQQLRADLLAGIPVEPPYAVLPAPQVVVDRTRLCATKLWALQLLALLSLCTMVTAGHTALTASFGVTNAVVAVCAGALGVLVSGLGLVGTFRMDRSTLHWAFFAMLWLLLAHFVSLVLVWGAWGEVHDRTLRGEWEVAYKSDADYEPAALVELQLDGGCCGFAAPDDLGVLCVELGLNETAGCASEVRELYAGDMQWTAWALSGAAGAGLVALLLGSLLSMRSQPQLRVLDLRSLFEKAEVWGVDPDMPLQALRSILKVQATFRGLLGRQRALRARRLAAWTRHAAERAAMRWAAVAALLLVAGAGAYAALVYALRFSDEARRAWGVSASLGLSFALLVLQPLRVCFEAALLPVLREMLVARRGRLKPQAARLSLQQQQRRLLQQKKSGKVGVSG